MSKNKLFCALLAILLPVLSSCAAKPAEQIPEASLIAPEEVHYETVTIQKQDYVKVNKGNASVQYYINDELKWDTANSRLQEIHVIRNQEVKAGDVLATFTTAIDVPHLENLRLQLRRAEEALAEGKEERMKEIRHAERNIEYHFPLEKKIALLELESLQIDYDMYVYQQETAIAKLREQIYEIENTITENAIVAPYDGVINWVSSYNPGDSVGKGSTILRMHSTDKFIVFVSESADKLRYNQDVVLEAGRKNKRETFAGKVITAPNVIPDDVNMNVAVIQAAEGVTAEDLAVSVNFSVNAEEVSDAILVDRKLLTQESGKFAVNILEDDMVKKRYVTVASNNLQTYWILDGLTEGQTLVVN